jgi:hypothetical protein
VLDERKNRRDRLGIGLSKADFDPKPVAFVFLVNIRVVVGPQFRGPERRT